MHGEVGPRALVPVGSSGDRLKGTGASDSYSVGRSGGSLVPVGSSGRSASEGYSIGCSGGHWDL